MKKFTLYHQLYEGLWAAKFAFEAVTEAEALSKAKGWAIYHSFTTRDVKIEPATEHEAQHWMHNEYVD